MDFFFERKRLVRQTYEIFSFDIQEHLMRSELSFFDRLSGLFSGLSGKNRKRQWTQLHGRSLQLEQLESREMLTIVGFMDVKHASEGGDAGYFRLHRDDPQGVVSVDFVVDSRVGVSGVATNGVDYALLPGTTETHSRGSVTFPDGVLTVDIPVVPFDDLSVEGTEAVTVTLLPALATTSGGEPLYTLGANMQATLLLGDAPPVASGIPRVSGLPEIIRRNDFTLRFHANGADVLSWKVNWGDNSPVQTFSGTATEAVHCYPNGGRDYNISVEAVYQVVTPAQPAPREGLSVKATRPTGRVTRPATITKRYSASTTRPSPARFPRPWRLRATASRLYGGNRRPRF